MDLVDTSPSVPCKYCHVYNIIHSDYPINVATHDVETVVPRCEIHYQFTCGECESSKHFNGIGYCGHCDRYSCISCSGDGLEWCKFLVYDYYYKMKCSSCKSQVKALDYLETQGYHPFQIGAQRPSTDLKMWLPFSDKIDYDPSQKLWGQKKLDEWTRTGRFEPVLEYAGDSKQVWNMIAENWRKVIPVDTNHKYIIIPKMLEFLDPAQKTVMDVACGEGNFSREMASRGYSVTGTDISDLVDYAILMEEANSLDISYQKLGIHDLKNHYTKNSFGQVTCNMALMDIDNLPLSLENIAYILKPGGQFVFSITHPTFGWPVGKSLKLPWDSQRNEDKGWVVDNYHLEQPTKIHVAGLPGPMLIYARKMSTYVNTLLDYGFTITKLSEPIPDKTTIEMFPRDMLNDYDRNSSFMIFQTRYL